MTRNRWTPGPTTNPAVRAQYEALANVFPAPLSASAPVRADAARKELDRHLMGKPKPRRAKGMNKAEARFDAYLSGIPHKFESVRLKLTDNTTYTPDFYVPGEKRFYEVKAWWKKTGKPHWEDDARVKFKMAAELYPEFSFVAVWWNPLHDQFEYERLGDQS